MLGLFTCAASASVGCNCTGCCQDEPPPPPPPPSLPHTDVTDAAHSVLRLRVNLTNATNYALPCATRLAAAADSMRALSEASGVPEGVLSLKLVSASAGASSCIADLDIATPENKDAVWQSGMLAWLRAHVATVSAILDGASPLGTPERVIAGAGLITLNAGGVAGVAVGAAVLLFLLCWAGERAYSRCCAPRRVRLFLSYRVSSDLELVEELHAKLLELGLDVWWDKVSLEPGRRWEEGFADGLCGAKIFVPVLSAGGLRPFERLGAQSACDNVLLEHLLALELRQRGLMDAIFPVFVGDVDADGRHGHFFEDGGMPDCAATAAVPAVDAKALEHLRRHLGAKKAAALLLSDKERAPMAVLRELNTHQGGFVHGDHDDSLDAIAAALAMCVDKILAPDSEGADDGASRGSAAKLPSRSTQRNLVVGYRASQRSNGGSLPQSERSTVGSGLRAHRRADDRATLVGRNAAPEIGLAARLRRWFAPQPMVSAALASGERHKPPPAASLVPESARSGKSALIKSFFSDTTKAERRAETAHTTPHEALAVNPVLVHRADSQLATERHARGVTQHGKSGLTRLGLGLGADGRAATHEQQQLDRVGRYLSRCEDVSTSAQRGAMNPAQELRLKNHIARKSVDVTARQEVDTVVQTNRALLRARGMTNSVEELNERL